MNESLLTTTYSELEKIGIGRFDEDGEWVWSLTANQTMSEVEEPSKEELL